MSNEYLAVVKRQLDAFNNRDIDAIMSMYTDDAEFFEFPSTPLFSGSAAIRDHFSALFEEPDLSARLMSSMVIDPTVISFRRIDRTFPEGHGWIAGAMIYEVVGDKIARTWSLMGDRVLV